MKKTILIILICIALVVAAFAVLSFMNIEPFSTFREAAPNLISQFLSAVGKPVQECSDSDGGLAYSTYGTCTDALGKLSDSCVIGGTYDGQLAESYCKKVKGRTSCAISYHACSPNEVCKNGVCVYEAPSCLNDAGCSSVGSFCDGNIPYNCTTGSDGCLDRVNGSACGSGYYCENGICISNFCSSITDCSDYTDENNCTTDFCNIGICKWNLSSGVCEESPITILEYSTNEDTPINITLNSFIIGNWTRVTSPVHGTVQNKSSLTNVNFINLTYTPGLNYNGKDYLEYLINGTTNEVIKVNITIIPVDDAPKINIPNLIFAIYVGETFSDKTYKISVTEVDGDVLEYSALNLPQGTTYPPQFDTSTGTLTWTITLNDLNGQDNLTFTNVNFTVKDKNKVYSDSKIINITIRQGNEYYVDVVNGNDSNSGTSALPWKTLARAYTFYSGSGSKVQEGDIVIVRNGSYGTYSEAYVDRTDWVTYKAAEGHNPEFTAIDINWNGPTSNKYLRFDGITIRPQPSNEYPISLRHSRHAQFLNLNVIGQGCRYSSRGFNSRYSSDITIDNCTFSGGNKTGRFDGFQEVIYLRNVDNVNITNSEIRQFKNMGIFIPATSNIIRNSNIHKFGGDAGIMIAGGEGGLIIENNKIHDVDVYYPKLQEIPTETTWSEDGTIMTNPNANWGSAGEPFGWVGTIEIIINSGNNVKTGDNEVGVTEIISPTQIRLSKSIKNDSLGPAPTNVDYILRDVTHADLLQVEGANVYNLVIRGNELYDSLGGWAFMHIWPLNSANPNGIGGHNFIIENNLCWNSYANANEEYGTPINVRSTDGVIFRNNTVIGRLEFRDNFKNVTFSNNMISYYGPYGSNPGVDAGDYNIVNRGSSNVPGSHSIFLNGKWNDTKFINIFSDYYEGNFSPVINNYACNGSINPPGVAVGALPCVCTQDSQCIEVFGLGDTCDIPTGRCSSMPTLSPFTKLWNFLKSLLTAKTGNAITGNVVNEADEKGEFKVSYIILSLLAVMILIIAVIIAKKRTKKKRFRKKIRKRGCFE